MEPEDFLSVIIRLPRNDIIYDALLKKWNIHKKLLMDLKMKLSPQTINAINAGLKAVNFFINTETKI